MKEYGLQFPIWSVANSFTTPDHLDSCTVIRVSDAEFGPCVPVFTSFELAERFLAEAEVEFQRDYQVVQLDHPRELIAVVEYLAQTGCEYAIVNCSLIDEGIPVTFIPIQSLTGYTNEPP